MKLEKEYVSKPWGHEEVFVKTDKYVGKILLIKPRSALSRQYHERKDETIRVLQGTLYLEIGKSGDAEFKRCWLEEGEIFRISPRTIHLMANASDTMYVKVLEISTPELDDVVRLEDNYGRI